MTDASDRTVIGSLKKNSREKLFVSLDRYKDHDLVSQRIWFQPDDDGDLRPGKGGVALRIEVLPELIELLELARAEAVRRGLLKVPA